MVPPQFAPGELCSWKDIASYLGVSVKTAQTWERDRGLPVRRYPGDTRVQVRALVAELETWKSGSPTAVPVLPAVQSQPAEGASASHARWPWLVSAIVIFIGFAVAFVLWWPQPVVKEVRIEPDAIVALDGRGKDLWRYVVPRTDPTRYLDGEQHTWVGDLDHDGRPEVLFIPIPVGLVKDAVPLVCLDNLGRERWRFVPGKAVSRGTDRFEPPFVVRQFAVMGERIIVTSHHHLYYPSQIAVLDPNGKMLREYWHSGHLNVLATGRYDGKNVIFAGGVNNLRHTATLVVLDPDELTGAVQEGGAPAFQGLPRGAEKARILFPRSCLNLKDQYNAAIQILPQDSGVLVSVHERLWGNEHPSIAYHFSPDLVLQQAVPSDLFLNMHKRDADHPWTADEHAALRQVQRHEEWRPSAVRSTSSWPSK